MPSNQTKQKALLKPRHQIVYCHVQDTLWGGLTPLQRSSRCILQPQLIGQTSVFACVYMNLCVYVYIYVSMPVCMFECMYM